jgi:DtxR family Mn-dependent transcriptional regulator
LCPLVNLLTVQELSFTEENYLKAIWSLQQRSESGAAGASVNDIAARASTKPATVTDMLRKLSEKGLIRYEKYRPVHLTEEGTAQALGVLRKHRLWETFLHVTLGFSWDEVHEVAEQLEHIQSPKLIERLDSFLRHPRFDPHGDPIPDAAGGLAPLPSLTLAAVGVGTACRIVAVRDGDSAFLQQLEKLGLRLDAAIVVEERLAYDGSVAVRVEGEKSAVWVSEKMAGGVLVDCGPESAA